MWCGRLAVVVLPGLAAAFLLIAPGCGTWYSGLRLQGDEVSAAYAEALERHTRRGWRTKGFDNVVSVTATLHTSGFGEAVRAEQARLLTTSASGPSEFSGALGGGTGVSVVLFIEALQPAWERLDRREPVWRFFLEVDGARHEPSSIAALDVRDANLIHLFPYVTRFGRAWLLTFPVDDPGTHPVLWMTGAPAQLRLEFEL